MPARFCILLGNQLLNFVPSSHFRSESASKTESGASILELMVVVVIGFILSAIGLPGAVDLISSFERNVARSQLETDIRRVRSEALAAGARVQLTINGDGAGYSVGIDYIPYADPPAPDVVLYNQTLPSGITVYATQVILFDARGFLIDNTGDYTTTTVTIQEGTETFALANVFPSGVIEHADYY